MSPTTVKVPKEMEPLFAKAEAVVSQYFRERKDDPSKGTIEIFGQRYMLVRGAGLSVEFFSLVKEIFGKGRETEAEDFARNMLFDLAHAVGKSDARNFHAKMGLNDPIERLSAGPIHFSHTGWAFVDISAESRPSPDENYFLLYDHPQSFEADTWIQSRLKPGFPVCIMNAGYSSGWCEESFGVRLVATEILCRAKGDPCCRFVMAPPDRIEEHVARYMKEMPQFARSMESHTIPDFFSRKRLEEGLRKSEQQHRAILEAVTDSLLVFDLEGRIVEANPAACRMYGYSHEEMLRLSGKDIIHPDYAHLFDDFLQQLRTCGSFHTESVDVRKGGSSFDVEVRCSPLDFNGEPCLLAVVRDITDRRTTEEKLRDGNAKVKAALRREKHTSMQLEAAMEQLEAAMQSANAANQAKSDFLANMSHEIRTPMTAILGFAENLMDPELSESERLSAVHTIHRNGEHLLGLINDILDLSKIEAGKMTAERVRCSPCKLIAELASLAKASAGAKHLLFDVEYVGPMPETICTDPVRLRQILINLVGNAIKFTETGGVRLIAGFVDGQEPLVQFDVLDTGIGMAREHVARLFQPFTQGDSTITRKFGGTGLGLAISKCLAEMLGGNISVTHSRVGEGTAIRVTVSAGPMDGVKMVDDPKSATLAVPEPLSAASAPMERLDCRVLLAEDGPDNQRLITYVLQKAGAEVMVAENGLAAIDKALSARNEGRPFDVILMDMQMPVLDGYQAAGLLRQKGYRGPIIALTANAMASDRDKCINAGCNDYASKPIDRRKLIEKILLYRDRSRRQDSAACPVLA